MTDIFALIAYPKAVTLLLTAMFVLGWVGYFIHTFKRKQYDVGRGYHRFYIGYSLSLCAWIISNAYFHTELPLQLSHSASIGMATISNLCAYSAFAFAYVFSCKLRADEHTPRLNLVQKALLGVLSSLTFGINLVPGLTIVDVAVTAPSQFVIQFGSLTSLFFSLVVILIILTLNNLLNIRSQQFRLLKVRSSYMIAGIVIFMLSTLTIQVGMTFFFNDFSLTWLPPALSISEMLFVGYALLTSRFYSAKYLTYAAISIMLTAGLYSISLLLIDIPLPYTTHPLAIAVICALVGLTWRPIYQKVSHVASLIIYGEKLTPVEQILALEENFKHSIDSAIVQLASLLNIPCDKLRLVTSNYNHIQYAEYLPTNSSALVYDELTEQIGFSYQKARQLKQLHDKMNSSNAALVLPLFNNKRSITHFLISPHKIDNSVFSNEEISALQRLLQRVQNTIEADRKVRQSQALANSIAHEMRNPLAQVQLQFETLKQHINSHAPDTILLDGIDNGHAAIRRGRQLIDIILREVSNASQEHEPTAITSIHKAITQAVESYGFDNADTRSRVQLPTQADFAVNINETLFNFVIFNLLRNAIYYFDSYPDSQIDIQTLTGQYENVLIFRDTGPGIPEPIAHRIFDNFFSYQKSGGSGLGLGYCQRVMRSFGGRIECRSAENQYTEFLLYFPALSHIHRELHPQHASVNARLDTAPCPAEQPRRQVLVHHHSPTVLIVDDKEVQRTLVDMYLSQLGVNCIQANNGRTALNMFKSNQVDLILMDVQMPVMNGFDASRQIKAIAPDIPIIALSGESGPKELAMIQTLMDDRLAKPTTIAALKQVLNRWLNFTPSPQEAVVEH
ncbi:hybrid sensor histidine kinase/response regulator [Vibrio sp. CAU 1672]|uniref:hybrid sensor histidine kinase/response regulator n=1 Tax=Vibrio sp. CAU 1672 TaxID=3032594 RepID=UPI0023DB67E4|nr:hybrid sensor histidine kinase/response regulator [Vibrio sp. CAU 1672]MDF2154263.1 hybrid sensor histidine kinase/response regulator [Vibrio sp. CAU 1672]